MRTDKAYGETIMKIQPQSNLMKKPDITM